VDVHTRTMSSLVLRQNLSVVDRATYFTSIWFGRRSTSFSCSQVRGWLTDLELVGTDGDKWSSVQVHKLVVLPLFSSLTDFPLETEDAKIVFPDVPTEVIRSLIQLLYTGECQLSPVADVVSILSLASVLGLFIHPDRLKVCVKESDNGNVMEEVENVVTVTNRNVKERGNGSVMKEVQNAGPNKNVKESGNGIVMEEVENAVTNKNVKESGNGSVMKDVENAGPIKKLKVNKVSKRVLLVPMTEDFPTVTSSIEQEMTSNVSKNNVKVKPVHLKFSCEHCNFRCRFRLGLEKHANTVHKDKKFRCEKCDYETTKLRNVKIHDKHIHVGEGRLVCQECGFKAKTDSKLAWHENHVHKSSTKKDGKSVESMLKLKPTLKERAKKTLRVKKSFPVDILYCHACDFKTFYKKSLAKHVLKFHKSKNM